MINSILTHGPYIVLKDRFALPHASGGSGVNRLSMSLLVVEEEVDLLGKPVNVFMVSAPVDNSSHRRVPRGVASTCGGTAECAQSKDGYSKSGF
ncbi:MAG: PTS sugar transporter subunit IIA [Tannerellaceae bacterium]